jgi:hypothetical protein
VAGAPGSTRVAGAPGSTRVAGAPGSTRVAGAPGSARVAGAPGSAHANGTHGAKLPRLRSCDVQAREARFSCLRGRTAGRQAGRQGAAVEAALDLRRRLGGLGFRCPQPSALSPQLTASDSWGDAAELFAPRRWVSGIGLRA